MHRFDAPWDRALLASTWLTVLVLAGLAAWLSSLGWISAGPAGGPLVPLHLVSVPLGAFLLLTWALAPRGFAVEGGELVVERRLGTLRIPLSSVLAVELLPALPQAGSLRLLGTSGLFGHYGRFWSKRLGHFRLYATRRSGLVVVDAEGGRYVLSPEPAEAFVSALRRAAPRAAAGPGRQGGLGRSPRAGPRPS